VQFPGKALGGATQGWGARCPFSLATKRTLNAVGAFGFFS